MPLHCFFSTGTILIALAFLLCALEPDDDEDWWR